MVRLTSELIVVPAIFHPRILDTGELLTEPLDNHIDGDDIDLFMC